MFQIITQILTTQKAGLAPEQNEDATAVVGLRVAIADGASEGWQSGQWAGILAHAAASDFPDPKTYPQWLLSAQHLAPRETLGGVAGSWYAEEKQALGAFSTLLAVAFDVPKTGSGIKWRAIAVGDSCLFHLRGDKVVTRFPLEDVEAFSNRPALVASLPTSELLEPEWFAGRAELTDRFYLATDALAEWFYRYACDHQAEPWRVFDRLMNDRSPADFETWVQAERTAKRLKNDDTTLIRILFAPAPATAAD